MKKTYSLPSWASGNDMASDFYNTFEISDFCKKKNKKKKGKQKKYDFFLKSCGKQNKKSKKRAKWELEHRIIEKTANSAIETFSDVVKMYAESKFFPNGRGNKSNAINQMLIPQKSFEVVAVQ